MSAGHDHAPTFEGLSDDYRRRLIAVTHGMSTAFFTPLELDAQEQSQFSA